MGDFNLKRQNLFSPGECEADCPIRTVMHVCHGKRRCVLEARRENFGDPCRQGVTPYLSVVYTCGKVTEYQIDAPVSKQFRIKLPCKKTWIVQ